MPRSGRRARHAAGATASRLRPPRLRVPEPLAHRLGQELLHYVPRDRRTRRLAQLDEAELVEPPALRRGGCRPDRVSVRVFADGHASSVEAAESPHWPLLAPKKRRMRPNAGFLGVERAEDHTEATQEVVSHFS